LPNDPSDERPTGTRPEADSRDQPRPGGRADPGDDLVSCRGLTKEYRTAAGTVRALKLVDSDFPAGQLTVVVGPSGAGKSSLLRILACVDRPTAGSVRIAGLEVSRLAARARRRVRRELVGYVFQQPSDNLLPYLTAAGHLDLSARLRGREAPGAAERLLDVLGLAHRAGFMPAQLSGGEQQRLAFAAAVIGGPALVVADEPTAELDHHAGESLLQAIGDLRAEGTSFLVSSHDQAVVRVADRVLQLHDGAVVKEVA
jgi:putative ABC transport system ATP-binding protein